MKRILLSFCIFGVFGCDVPENVSIANDDVSNMRKDIDYDELPNNAVLIDVGGRKLTKGGLERQVEMQAALYRMRRKGIKKTSGEMLARMRATTFSRFEPMSLILLQAKEDGIVASDSEMRMAKERYSRIFRSDFDELVNNSNVKQFKEDVIRRLDEDLIVEKYLQVNYSNELTVSEAMVSNRLAHVAKYNAMAQATNDLVYARATNVWKLVKAGSDFSAMADKYSEDPEKARGGVLGECNKEDFAEIQGYWDIVGKLKTGEVSPVLRTDVGLEIVKCIRIVPAAESQTTQDAHLLSRIFFNLANFYRDYTPQEILHVLTKNNREEVTALVMKALGRKYKVVYPYGKNILNRTGKKRRTASNL